MDDCGTPSTTERLRQVVQEVQNGNDNEHAGKDNHDDHDVDEGDGDKGNDPASLANDKLSVGSDKHTEDVPKRESRKQSKLESQRSSESLLISNRQGWDLLFESQVSKKNSTKERRNQSNKNKNRRKSAVITRGKHQHVKKNAKESVDDEEKKECTFTPAINPLSRSLASGEGAFLKRMESKASATRKRLEKKAGQKEYDALVDKKICPRCGATQSYDEVLKRQPACQECKVRYSHRCSWRAVANQFLKRQEDSLEKKQIRSSNKWNHPFRPNAEKVVYDPGTGKYVSVKTTKLAWHDVKDSFMERLETDLQRREAKQSVLEQKNAEKVTDGCPFRPNINSTYSSSRACEGSFMERMERDLEKREQKADEMEYHTMRSGGGEMNDIYTADAEILWKKMKAEGQCAPKKDRLETPCWYFE